MVAIRNLLDFLADEDSSAIDRLCGIRGLSGRGKDAKCESLARSYRGDHEELLEELRKQDLVRLLADPTEIDGVDYYLPSASSFNKEDLVAMGMSLFRDEEVPQQFLALDDEEEEGEENDEGEDDEEENEDEEDDEDDSSGNAVLSLSELKLIDLLGSTSLVSLRGSAQLSKWLASAANMKAAKLRRTFQSNHGRKLLRNVLQDLWPIQVPKGYGAALSTVRVAAVKRSPTLVETVARLLGLPHSSVLKTLSGVAGNMLMGNVFAELAETDNMIEEATPTEANRSTNEQAATRLRTHFVAGHDTVPVGTLLVDRWRVVRSLGRGGFGDVFEICSPGGMRRVAKFARVGSAPDKSVASSLLFNELKHLQDLDHAHICRVFGMRSDPTFGDFLQLEHGGSSLIDHSNGRPLTHREAARIVRDVAGALDYLHREDVIHGDVTPSNILLDDSMHVRLTDFGTSARLKSSTSAQHTRLATQGPALSPAYAPPEARHSAKITKHGDQYSLAMVYVALVTGNHHRPQIEPALERAPQHVEEALLRALHVMPQRRFETCTAFARALTS